MATAKQILEDAKIKLDGGVTEQGDATANSDVWWTAWSKVTAELGKHSNSVAMVLAEEDSSSDLPLELATRLAAAVDNLLKATRSLPPSAGPCLSKEIANLVEDLGQDARDFLGSAAGCIGGSVPKSQVRQKAGILWDRCESAEKVSRSEEQACMTSIKRQHILVADAIRELEEDIEASRSSEDDDHDYDYEEDEVPRWTSQECLIVAPGVGLLKVVGNLLKKLSVSISDSDEKHREHHEALHLLAEEAQKLSPLVDDFVLLLYSPIKMTDLLGSAEALAAQVTATVEASSACNVRDSKEQSWRKFLLDAAEHNVTKLKNIK